MADKYAKTLGHPDNLHLLAAQGWIELGNHLEANEALENITASLRAHPDVLEVRLHIYAKAKKWDAYIDIATVIIKLDPERYDAWIQRSFALHELKRTQEAFDQLLPVAEKFPKVWTIPYNLACYCAQLGRLAESEQWLERAMAMDVITVVRVALEDPDLNPLRESFRGRPRDRAR